MNLVVLPQRALLEGRDLLTLGATESFLAAFGEPSRRRDIPMQPGGTRVAMVWDSLGLVAYEDRPEHQLSHFFLAFSPAHTPEHPSRASDATVEINGAAVTAQTTAATLPREGPTPVSMSFGQHFFHQSATFEVSFLFGRRPDPRSRGVRTGCLHSVSFSWRRVPA